MRRMQMTEEIMQDICRGGDKDEDKRNDVEVNKRPVRQDRSKEVDTTHLKGREINCMKKSTGIQQ